MMRSPAEALSSCVPPPVKLRSISRRWNGSKNSPENECVLPRRFQEAMQYLQFREESQRLRCCRRGAQLQRAAPLEMPEGAAKLLAGIGAQHRVELAATRRQATEIDGVGGECGFASAEPAGLDRRLGKAQQGAVDIEFVRHVAEIGEPGDRRIENRRFAANLGKDAVVLDRDRIEARMAGLVEVKSA